MLLEAVLAAEEHIFAENEFVVLLGVGGLALVNTGGVDVHVQLFLLLFVEELVLHLLAQLFCHV